MQLNFFYSITKPPQNGMSQYPSYYIPPVYSKELQTALIKNGEVNKLAHIPIKAALIDQTCSTIHDPAVKYV